MDVLQREYQDALEKLAGMLNLRYSEVANFFGGIEDGAFGARRLKEFFKGSQISDILDLIVRISEEYRGRGGENGTSAAC